MEKEKLFPTYISSYHVLAQEVMQEQVRAMQTEFPDEEFPVRPPYRKAMYHRLLIIVDELNHKMDELLLDCPDEHDYELREKLMSLQEWYEKEFVRRVRKQEDPQKTTI